MKTMTSIKENLLNYKEFLYGNELGGVIVTLDNGVCACVDTNSKTIVLEILLDSFLKWGAFNSIPTEDEINLAKMIIKNPREVSYGPMVKEYFENNDVKQKFDKIKKDCGYKY